MDLLSPGILSDSRRRTVLVASGLWLLAQLTGCSPKSLVSTPAVRELPPHLPAGAIVYEVNRGLAFGDEPTTLAAAFGRLRSRLRIAGFDDPRLYAVGSNGVALVCRLERIDSLGNPQNPRWLPEPAGSRSSLDHRILDDAASKGDSIGYRIVVLVIATNPPGLSSTERTPEEMERFFQLGSPTLEAPLDSVTVTTQKCVAYVYQYGVAREKLDRFIQISGQLTAADHLVAAGIWSRSELAGS